MRINQVMKAAFFLSAVLLLIGNFIILNKNINSEWRHYQSEYISLALENTDDAKVKEVLMNRTPRIEQLIVNDFGPKRVDRCMTCHAGVDDDNFKDAEQPYKTHPEIPGLHPYRIYGCTICHDGNGRGLTAEDAHGEKKHWMSPMHKGEMIEAGCAKCHNSPYIEETPRLKAGSELFFTRGCYGCHKVEGVSDGNLGVELTTVALKWKVDYLEESIVVPKANNFESLMPKMDLPDDEVLSLTVYLKSLTGENLVDGSIRKYHQMKKWKSVEPNEVEVNYAVGEKLFQEKSCIICHSIDGVGGHVAPDLSVEGLQRNKEWITRHNINPRSLVAGSIMPNFKLSETELAALTEFLSGQKDLNPVETESNLEN